MKFKQAGFCEITSRGGYSGPIRIRACLKILRDSLEDFLLLQDLRQKLLNSWIQTFEFFCYSDILKTYIYTYIYIYIYIYICTQLMVICVLCFIDHVFLYNFANKSN